VHPFGGPDRRTRVKLQSFCKKGVGQTKPFHIHLAVKKGKNEDDPEAG